MFPFRKAFLTTNTLMVALTCTVDHNGNPIRKIFNTRTQITDPSLTISHLLKQAAKKSSTLIPIDKIPLGKSTLKS